MTTATNSRCLLALAIAAATLAGCTAQDSPMGEELDPTKPVALQVTSTIDKSLDKPMTRYYVLTEGNIGIFLDGEKYTAKHNIKYKYQANTSAAINWVAAAADETLYLRTADANVCAYYPYAEGNTDKTKIAMTTRRYDRDRVFYYEKNKTLNAALPTANFYLRHAYASVWLAFSVGSSYPLNSIDVGNISINNPTLPLEGMLNIATGTYIHTKLGGYTIIDSPRETTKGGSHLFYQLMVVPHETEFNTPSTVTFEANRIPMTATIPIADLPKIEAGKDYTINIEIGGRPMVPTVAITPWEVSVIPNFNGAEAVPDI